MLLKQGLSGALSPSMHNIFELCIYYTMRFSSLGRRHVATARTTGNRVIDQSCWVLRSFNGRFVEFLRIGSSRKRWRGLYSCGPQFGATFCQNFWEIACVTGDRYTNDFPMGGNVRDKIEIHSFAGCPSLAKIVYEVCNVTLRDFKVVGIKSAFFLPFGSECTTARHCSCLPLIQSSDLRVFSYLVDNI